jgi:DNA repair protein RecO (recombination protein O)
MKTTLNGIYLGHTNYSDTSVIARVFTAQYGRKSFLFKGVKSKKGQSGLLMPCNHLELTCHFNPNKELNVVYAIQLKEPRYSIGGDYKKMAVAIFLTEVLNKSLHIETDETELYEYVAKQISFFDTTEFSPNFHLYFLLGLSHYLGFFPQYSCASTENFFNIKEGVFDFAASEIYHLDGVASSLLQRLLTHYSHNINSLNITHKERIILLRSLVKFYEIQLEPCEINSLDVLIEIFQ